MRKICSLGLEELYSLGSWWARRELPLCKKGGVIRGGSGQTGEDNFWVSSEMLPNQGSLVWYMTSSCLKGWQDLVYKRKMIRFYLINTRNELTQSGFISVLFK